MAALARVHEPTTHEGAGAVHVGPRPEAGRTTATGAASARIMRAASAAASSSAAAAASAPGSATPCAAAAPRERLVVGGRVGVLV